MKAKAWRLYGAKDMRLEDIELEAAGDEGIVVELVTNTICLSDYKGVTLGTGHKRVPRDIATRPTMFGHEISGIVREVGEKWKDQFKVGQHVGLLVERGIPILDTDSLPQNMTAYSRLAGEGYSGAVVLAPAKND